MKDTLLFVMAFVLVACLPAIAQEAETIDHVTDDNVIVLQNGRAYESIDVTSQTWNSGDEVLVLNDDTIVNKDTNEAVDTTETSAPDDEDDPQIKNSPLLSSLGTDSSTCSLGNRVGPRIWLAKNQLEVE